MAGTSKNNRVRIATHYMTNGKNYTKTAKQYGITPATVKSYVKEFGNEPTVIAAVATIEKKDEAVQNIQAEIVLSTDELLVQAKKAAGGINQLAIKRIRQLLPKEKNLDRVLKVYQATHQVVHGEIKNDEFASKKITNHFEYIENLIVEGSKNA